MAALVVSGLTAVPLEAEARWLAGLVGADDPDASPLAAWIGDVRDGIMDVNARHPFLAYATDWLAFAHVAIAVAFVGPIRDPVRNAWVVTFGMIACGGVLVVALVAGPLRGIPLPWRLADCSFGILGFIPLWLVRRWTRELEASERR
jgi:hypothetical protein